MKNKIILLGLGPGNPDELSLRAYKYLRAKRLILRTERHGILPFLKEEGIDYISMDHIYDSSDNFDDAYRKMTEFVLSYAENEDVILGLPGHPMIGEALVDFIIEKAEHEDIKIEVIAGISRELDVIGKYPPLGNISPMLFLYGTELDLNQLNTDITTTIMDLDTYLKVSDIKLSLLRLYPPNHLVHIFTNHREVKSMPISLELHELDGEDIFDESSCIVIPPVDFEELNSYSFDKLVSILERLRSKDGCPWDREQTHASLKKCLLEETYEVLEAIEKEDYDAIIEELGDLLLQVVFHSQIGKEHGEFDILDVISSVSAKMVHRHPHIFGQMDLKSSEEVLIEWDLIKREEKGQDSQTQVLKDIPKILPALTRAQKIQSKAASIGFDWDSSKDVLEKLDEEIAELLKAHGDRDLEALEEELGDVFFTLVNLARFLGLESEFVLMKANEKFIKRFAYMEASADRPLEEMSLVEMDKLWNEAKKVLE